MLYTNIQPSNFLGSGEENFYVISEYTGMAAILINRPKPFVQIFNSQLTEASQGSRRKKTGPGVSKEQLFKSVHGKRMDNARRVIITSHPKPSAPVS